MKLTAACLFLAFLMFSTAVGQGTPLVRTSTPLMVEKARDFLKEVYGVNLEIGAMLRDGMSFAACSKTKTAIVKNLKQADALVRDANSGLTYGPDEDFERLDASVGIIKLNAALNSLEAANGYLCFPKSENARDFAQIHAQLSELNIEMAAMTLERVRK